MAQMTLIISHNWTNTMDSIKDRIRRSLAQRGVSATVKLCVEDIRWRVSPSLRRAEAARREADEAFDRDYGVQTGGVYRPKETEVVGDNWALGVNYQAVNPSEFDEALKKLTIPHNEFTFVDLGSGKGRAILLACRFPFRRVIGVEYSRQLNQIACENIRLFPLNARKCRQIETVETDAAEFVFPNEPLLVFMYHPFAEPVMARVVDNLSRSLRANPRPAIVVYVLPQFVNLWNDTGLFRQIQANPAVFVSP
jgi:SAM-dependent methyltransferase